MPEKSGKNQGTRFQKGQSGNPSGKPPGTRARVTVLAEKLIEDQHDDIMKAVIERAKGGDPTAMRLCVERLIPARKGPWILARSATGSREADLGVFAKLFEDRLEGRLEAETFSRR